MTSEHMRGHIINWRTNLKELRVIKRKFAMHYACKLKRTRPCWKHIFFANPALGLTTVNWEPTDNEPHMNICNRRNKKFVVIYIYTHRLQSLRNQCRFSLQCAVSRPFRRCCCFGDSTTYSGCYRWRRSCCCKRLRRSWYARHATGSPHTVRLCCSLK